MAKFGKSADPQQQQLREHKKRWNIAAKEFRKRIGALSRALNGGGSAAYGLPPSDIKEPLPAEMGNFLNELSGNFQQLAEEALRIQQEQAFYSEHRRKPQQETEAPKIATASYQKKLIIGKNVVSTLLAITSEEQERGLMHQDWPPPIMSFIYSKPQVNRFWMKSTPSPLDIVFSLNGKITAIHRGEPFSTKLIGDNEFSDLVIELPYGSCSKLGVQIGDQVFLEKSGTI